MATTSEHEQTRILVQAAAQACEDKKGEDTRILELDPVDAGLADFFLVTSATNDRQSVAIADEIELRLKRQYGVMANSVEGRRRGEWILLDYVHFVVHVFLKERRSFYDIERLRKSARPLSPAEFEGELKAALAEKTRSARSKTGAADEDGPEKPVKKSAAKKAGAKKSAAAKKGPVKKAAGQGAAKKAGPAKSAAAKAPAKAAKKEAPAKKAAVKKAGAKKSARR